MPSGLYALVVGALSLCIKGAYFTIITLAFAQMAYFQANEQHDMDAVFKVWVTR